jgi:hypothetical protein
MKQGGTNRSLLQQHIQIRIKPFLGNPTGLFISVQGPQSIARTTLGPIFGNGEDHGEGTGGGVGGFADSFGEAFHPVFGLVVVGGANDGDVE